MRIRDVAPSDVAAGRNWRVKAFAAIDDAMMEWEIEECLTCGDDDTVVYSALEVDGNGEVWPLLMAREVGECEWWGDTCVYFDGAWRELDRVDIADGCHKWESYVANPLVNDLSFMDECTRDVQRAGFARWRGGLQEREGVLERPLGSLLRLIAERS